MTQRIAAAAADLFDREGYGAVSMRRLAKEVGVTPMALYTYFPSKLAILASLWSRILATACADFERMAAATKPPTDRLRNIAESYVGHWLQNRGDYHLVFMSSGLSREEVTDFMSDGQAVELFRPLFTVMAEALDTDPNDAVVKLRTDQLVCSIHGVMHCLITMPGYDWPDPGDLLDAMVESAAARAPGAP